jgi:hypothetical protein
MARVLLLLCLSAQATVAQEAWLDQAGVQRWTRGEYIYKKLSTGAENGHERFLLVVDPQGVRTLQASNAFRDRMDVWRHVVYRVAANFRPLDVYLDYNTDGAWRGTGFFTIGADKMDAVISGPDGVQRASVDVPEQFSLIPHPIATNSWPAWYYDRAKGGSQPVTLYAFDGLAKDEDGILGGFQQQTIRLTGRTTLRVPAGEFECDRYEFNDGDPSICLHGPDQLIVRMVWKLADVEYLLSAYTTGPQPTEESE